jgi:hypothetical protein
MAAATFAAAGVVLTAGVSSAADLQCKKSCDTGYQSCLTKSDQDSCLKSWNMCKRKCLGQPINPVYVPASTPAPAAPPAKKH